MARQAVVTAPRKRIGARRYHGDRDKTPPVRISPISPLALGSASPRRRELLATMGVPLVVRAASVDEAGRAGEAPDAYLRRITLAKLDAVRASGPAGEVAGVLVADTIVVSPDGAILGKPSDAGVARRRTTQAETEAMIERLAGATHEVSTRFALAEAAPGSPVAHAETVTTRVTFRPLVGGEARAYAASGEGWDKAGGYAAQGRAAAFIARIDGSYTGVVGLPICEVVVALRALGWW
ncbi:MAG: Maf family protein [Myxococcales bacterium]|nr:Maf family protein [Myxococcales bacterium]